MSIAPTVTTKLPKWPTWPKSSVATGWPKTAALNVEAIKNLFAQGLNKSEIARRLKIGRTGCRPVIVICALCPRVTTVKLLILIITLSAISQCIIVSS